MTFCALPYRAYNIVETPPIDPPTTSVMIQNIASVSNSSSTTITTTAGRLYLFSGTNSGPGPWPEFDGTAAGISSIDVMVSRGFSSFGSNVSQFIFGGLCTTSSTGAITSNVAMNLNIDETIGTVASIDVYVSGDLATSSSVTNGTVISTTLPASSSTSNITYVAGFLGGSNPETGYTLLARNDGFGITAWKGSPDTSPSITSTTNSSGAGVQAFAILAVELAAST